MSEQFTGRVIAEKYRVDTFLRDGDPGGIYRGRHLFMDKPVTLKILPPALAMDDEMGRRFMAEANNASNFSHPNVLGVSDFGADADGLLYAVFEAFEGETLKQAILRDGQFPVDQAVLIASQITSALAAAHEKGFVYANLTPDSILLDSPAHGRTAKIFDFSVSPDDARRRIAKRSPVNVAYFAPEQFSGYKNTDGRSDIYSLGIILYQMLAGEVPFTGETPMDVMLKHAEEPPPPLSMFRRDVPAALETAIQKALAKDPDERYQSAEEFAGELDLIAAGTFALSTGSNNIWKTAVVVFAGILLLASVFIYATYTRRTDPVTQLQPDANGQPVQPINPATGAEEQSLVGMPGSIYDTSAANTNMAQPPGTLPGGDNYNPWASGMPPPGAPPSTYVAPGGEVYTIDPNNPSQFMPMEGGVVLVPVPTNTNTAVKPTPSPKPPPANANTSPAPATKPTPELKGTPVREPAPAKTPDKPAADGKPEASGEPE